MNRLQNAQKQLAESLAALESAVEQAQNSTALAATGNGADTSMPTGLMRCAGAPGTSH